ncbi:MAG: hypothetical protein QOG07_3584 [Pseudonocardiales bacterium]|jgi:uncharacterized protein YndB with AHSA1/START domain|nr:hypothetical protein [Pseudonocardiales bacterium]MDT4983204.1 hypothetical protein [Pseudonocardiales bacterium]
MNGTLEQAGERWRLRFTRRLRHDPETVWRAITEPDQLKAWFPDHLSGDLVVGGRLTFSHDSASIPDFHGEVRAIESPLLLEFTWGTDLLRFEIEPNDDGCTLTLLDTFDEVGKAARDAAGWHVCLDQLALTLDGGAAPASSASQEWQNVHPGYVEAFGPDGSSIGPPEGWDDEAG